MTGPLASVAGGETGALIRAFDWTATPLGPPETWCPALSAATAIILAAAQPMLVAWGPRLNTLYNDAYRAILGERHPAVGHPAAELWADAWHALGPLVAEALEGRACHLVDQEVARNGRPTAWFTFSLTPLRDEDGAVGGIFCAATETTDHVLDRRARDSDSARQLLEARKLDALGRLAGGVAHDLNNLLTPVIAGLDLLRRRHDDAGSRRLVDAALASAGRARALVARLLDFARQRPVEVRAVAVEPLVEGMRDLLERSLGPAVRLAVDVPPGLPPVLVDADGLELALLNIAVNARDAMPDGGIFTIAARPAGEHVTISATDTGFGMDAETLARAREPFFTTKAAGGTGLGLSSVSAFAADSGGSLHLESAPGRGTTVILSLPLASQAASAAEADEAEAPRAPRAAHVLLVDDDEAARASIAEVLRDLGYSVEETAGAEDALRRLRGGFRPDLLITDQLMPGMSGTALAAAARSLGGELPVLLVTGAGAPADAVDGMSVLAKPFRGADLASAVAGLVA